MGADDYMTKPFSSRTPSTRLVPCDGYCRHDDSTRRTQNLQEDEPANGHAHVAQMLIGGTSQLIPIVGGNLALGRWQRLMLLELDNPRDRHVYFVVMSSDIGAPLVGLRGAPGGPG